MPRTLSSFLHPLVALFLISPTVLAENMFEASTGELILPVLEVSENQRFFARFSLLSDSPYRWQLSESAEVTADSRVAAQYQPATSSLWVPEISIDGQLYSLTFSVQGDCVEGVCLEPQLDSITDMGRSGAQIFTTVASPNSTFTCSTCHALTETDSFAADGFRRPGNPLLNVTKRPHYKGGELSSLREAINICRTEWMNTTAWEDTSQEWINLMNWLDDQATVEVADAIDLSVVAPVDELTGGSSANGQTLFNKSCAVCHGQDGVGTNLAPKIIDIGLQVEYIAQRIRHSGRSNSVVYPNLTGGVMPFWSETRLNNEEMLDIIAYVAGDTAAPGGSGDSNGSDSTDNSGSTGGSGGTDDSGGSGGSGGSDSSGGADNSGGSDSSGSSGGSGGSSSDSCASTHARVGHTATLSNLFHNVSGTAVIIDNCTIEIRNFTFDGGGINVHVYAGTNQQFHTTQGGFSLKSGLVGTAFNNGTLSITLPAGVTLDDFDSISIWCVPVGVSFGHGQFSAPAGGIPEVDIPADGTY